MKPAIILLFLLAAARLAAIDITTLDGKVYKDAEIITVTPAGLDIMFANAKGLPVLKGIDFSNLPEDLRKQYMKNPTQSEDYLREVNRFIADNLNDIIGNKQQELMRETRLQEKSTDRAALRKQLEHAIFAHRLGGEFRVVRNDTFGSIVFPANITAGEKPAVKSGLVFVYGLQEPPDTLCQGFIYPAGIKVNTAECVGLPVYATTAENAAGVLGFYLNIQSDYAVNGEKIKQVQSQSNDKASEIATPEDAGFSPPPQPQGIEDTLFSSSSTFYISSGYPTWYVNYYRRHHVPHPRPQPQPDRQSTVPPKAPMKIVDPRKPVITPNSFSSEHRDPFHPYGCPGADTGLFKKRQ